VSVFDLFPPEEFQIEIIPLPDGGAEIVYQLTGRTRELVERRAAAEGMTVDQYIRACILP
jgi:hypothetical protein